MTTILKHAVINCLNTDLLSECKVNKNKCTGHLQSAVSQRYQHAKVHELTNISTKGDEALHFIHHAVHEPYIPRFRV